jgi:hypothetical protein
MVSVCKAVDCCTDEARGTRMEPAVDTTSPTITCPNTIVVCTSDTNGRGHVADQPCSGHPQRRASEAGDTFSNRAFAGCGRPRGSSASFRPGIDQRRNQRLGLVRYPAGFDLLCSRGLDPFQPCDQQALHPLGVGPVFLAVGVVADQIGQLERVCLQVVERVERR